MDKIQQIGKRYFNKKIDEIIIIINIITRKIGNVLIRKHDI